MAHSNSTDSPFNTSIKFFDSPFKVERFLNSNLDASFGRESLGILHNSVLESFKRESLMLLSESEDYGRESLGILNLDGMDVGRESIGINTLKLNQSNVISATVAQELNNGFLLPRLDGDKSNLLLQNTTPPDFFDLAEESIIELEENHNNKTVEHIEDLNENLTELKLNNSIKKNNAQEILHNLSEVITNDPTINQQKKVEGQLLINGLVNLLITEDKTKDDSGHSSIDDENHHTDDNESPKSYPVLDLRIKKGSNDNNSNNNNNYDDQNGSGPLDLSFKSKGSDKSNDFLVPRIIDKSEKSSISSLNSTNSRNLSFVLQTDFHKFSINSSNNSSFKFKLKKTVDDGVSNSKGPMKAVIPIDNMTKRKSLCNSRTPSNPFTRTKKTTTPNNDPNIKPVAQSTPDVPSIIQFKNIALSPVSSNQSKIQSFPKKINFSPCNSGLPRENKPESTAFASGITKRYSTGESPQTKQQTMVKRRSLSELRSSPSTQNVKEISSKSSKLQRSFSVGKEPKVLSSVVKARENSRKYKMQQSLSSSSDVNVEKTKFSFLRKSSGGLAKPLLVKKGKENWAV